MRIVLTIGIIVISVFVVTSCINNKKSIVNDEKHLVEALASSIHNKDQKKYLSLYNKVEEDESIRNIQILELEELINSKIISIGVVPLDNEYGNKHEYNGKVYVPSIPIIGNIEIKYINNRYGKNAISMLVPFGKEDNIYCLVSVTSNQTRK